MATSERDRQIAMIESKFWSLIRMSVLQWCSCKHQILYCITAGSEPFDDYENHPHPLPPPIADIKIS